MRSRCTRHHVRVISLPAGQAQSPTATAECAVATAPSGPITNDPRCKSLTSLVRPSATSEVERSCVFSAGPAASHWERDQPKEGGRMRINTRNFEPQALGPVSIRLLDAASDWEGLEHLRPRNERKHVRRVSTERSITQHAFPSRATRASSAMGLLRRLQRTPSAAGRTSRTHRTGCPPGRGHSNCWSESSRPSRQVRVE